MSTVLQHPGWLLWLLIAGAVVACVLVALAVYLVWRASRKPEEKDTEAPEEEKVSQPFAAASQGIEESFRQAMRRLRERIPGWNYQYAAPWYVLVGERGSGKSTIADEISGLNSEFIDAQAGEAAPRWLLLDHAVLIDLPGAEFAGEKEGEAPEAALEIFKGALKGTKAADSADAWRGFLRLTSHYRPRQPLNGIVLTIPATELLKAVVDPDHQKRVSRLAEIGRRLNEVQAITGLAVPVYVLVTKCDAVEGFGSYARTILGRGLARALVPHEHFEEDGDELFGWSNPYSIEAGYSSSWVDEAFDSTEEVLLRHQLEMLAECKTVEQADGIFLFPFGLRQMRQPLKVLLDLVFGSTAYYDSHLLRGIYFSGRASETGAEMDKANVRTLQIAERSRPRVLFAKDLFTFKIFPERFLTMPVSRRILRGNRSVLLARIAACLLFIVLSVGLFHAWNRLRSLQSSTVNPILTSLTNSLNDIAHNPEADVSPAVGLFDALGLAQQGDFYSWAIPYSVFDLDGLRRNLKQTVEHTFEVVILASCQKALENRIQSAMSASFVPSPASSSSAFPLGNAWAADPEYLALLQYLDQVQELNVNIDRYGSISSAESGNFAQLNSLLRYLGARGLPSDSRFAHDSRYQQLLLKATWKPLEVPANYDEAVSNVAMQLIDGFYVRWFDENPLESELASLTGPDGLSVLNASKPYASNEQLRALSGKIRSVDNQLSTGSYDWIAGDFRRQNYPALGVQLDKVSFASDEFSSKVTLKGAAKLAGLREVVERTGVVDLNDQQVRLNGQVRTVAAVLDSLMSYDFMANENEKSASCRTLPRGYVWNQADLNRALQVDASRTKIESQLLPSLSGKYRSQIEEIVDNRAAGAVAALTLNAVVPGAGGGDNEVTLEASLQNFSQSADQIRQISQILAGHHATSMANCLNRSLVSQAESLLSQVNQQARDLYVHVTVSDDGANGAPASQWLFAVSSPDELQAYLANERQKVETLTASAVPLVKVLRTQGGYSSVLTKWRNISQDVDALQSKKPDNPIQALESFIGTKVDAITPENECKTPTLYASADMFLSIRTELSHLAAEHCRRIAVARYNAIATSFNNRLSGRFPFSTGLDTRAGAQAAPGDIAAFYQAVDQDGAGLIGTLVNTTAEPQQTTAFLHSIALARPLVTGTGNLSAPALGVMVQFRTNRNHESLGDRIASWNLRIGSQSADSETTRADASPLVWQLGDPVMLTIRYANNSPEIPAATNPSRAAKVKDRIVTYSYTDPWSLLTMLQDHAPNAGQAPEQYVLRIPNQYATSGSQNAPPDTVVYMQIGLVAPGAKPGSPTLPVPVFPAEAPAAVLRSTRGE